MTDYRERSPTPEEAYMQNTALGDLTKAPPRSSLEIDKDMYNPDAQQNFAEISRDTVLGNLTERDEEILGLVSGILQLSDIVIESLRNTGHTEEELKTMYSMKKVFEADAASISNTSRGRGGFTFDGLTKRRFELEHEYKTPREPKTRIGKFLSGGQ